MPVRIPRVREYATPALALCPARAALLGLDGVPGGVPQRSARLLRRAAALRVKSIFELAGARTKVFVSTDTIYINFVILNDKF